MKTSNSTLVIVDMQPYFEAVTDKTVNQVIKLIKTMKEENSFIVVLEYYNCGNTHQRINEELHGYDNSRYMTKSFDDGSNEVLKSLGRKIKAKKKITVCGVNTQACVYRTVMGLREELPNSEITVMKSACNTFKDKKLSFSCFEKVPNVVLI